MREAGNFKRLIPPRASQRILGPLAYTEPNRERIMTAQIGERLHCEDRELSMCSQPLDRFFTLAGICPRFDTRINTALWLGYVGTWDIRDARLYLIELNGTLEGRTEANLATVFPDFPERVFAHWHTGELRVRRQRRCSIPLC